MVRYGLFRRVETQLQTAADAVVQVQTGEVWGSVPFGGMEPTVQAYIGPLGTRRGIEFTTDTNPHPGGTPLEARWFLTQTPGVLARTKLGKDYACILADVINKQP